MSEIMDVLNENRKLKRKLDELTDELKTIRADAVKQNIDILNYSKGYSKGRDEAWECARKINCFIDDGGIGTDNLVNIFGTFMCYEIFRDFSASEAMKKIKEQEEKIRVGDEVIIASEKCVVLRVTKDGCLDRWMNLYGQTYANNTGYTNNEIKKTGKHYDQIANVLKMMKEEK